MDAFDIVYNKLNGWFETGVEMFPNFIAAVVVVLLFGLVARYIKKGTKKILGRATDSPAVTNLLANILSISIITAGLFIALGVLNLQKTVTSLLAGLGIIGLALGFAFQEIAANFISGIIISIRKPFAVGDIIKVADLFGNVENITLRTTNIRTFDGNKILIPNKDVFQSPIYNYTENGKRRVDLDVGISYGDDLEKVEKVVLETIQTMDGLKKDEDISFIYTGFGDSSINFTIRFWVEYSVRHLEYLNAKHIAVKKIKKAFDENDITIPFPIRTLDFGIKGGEKLSEMANQLPISIRKKTDDNS